MDTGHVSYRPPGQDNPVNGYDREVGRQAERASRALTRTVHYNPVGLSFYTERLAACFLAGIEGYAWERPTARRK